MVSPRISLAVLLVLGLASCRSRTCCPTEPDDSPPVGRYQVFLDCMVLRVPAGSLASAPWSSKGPVEISESQRQALFSEMKEGREVKLISAPKILVTDGQRSSIFAGEQAEMGREPSSMVVSSPRVEGHPTEPWLGLSLLTRARVIRGEGDNLVVDLNVDGLWRDSKQSDAKGDARWDATEVRLVGRTSIQSVVHLPGQSEVPSVGSIFIPADSSIQQDGKPYRVAMMITARILRP